MCSAYASDNEVVVESETWLRNLPHSVEAIFMIECESTAQNTQYHTADNGAGTASDCREAQSRARDLHRRFAKAYHLDAQRFPLLLLRPTDWERPFVAINY